MAHRIIIRLEAEVDLTDAAIWYHGQQPGLGEEFLAEVDIALAAAAENPCDSRVFVASRKYVEC